MIPNCPARHRGGAWQEPQAKKSKTKKITQVIFKANGTLVSKAKKKPFKATISTAGASGSIAVQAKVTIRVKKPGKKIKKIKKTIKQNVAIC